jgi:hypothetical protein
MQTHAWAISTTMYAPPLSNPTTYEVFTGISQLTVIDRRFKERCILYNRVFRPGFVASGETDCVDGRGLLREFDSESESVAYA